MPKLSKSICQKCYQENKWTWNNTMDADWNNGHILCPIISMNITGHFISNYLKSEYINKCPYCLEHVMSNQ